MRHHYLHHHHDQRHHQRDHRHRNRQSHGLLHFRRPHSRHVYLC